MDHKLGSNISKKDPTVTINMACSGQNGPKLVKNAKFTIFDGPLVLICN